MKLEHGKLFCTYHGGDDSIKKENQVEFPRESPHKPPLSQFYTRTLPVFVPFDTGPIPYYKLNKYCSIQKRNKDDGISLAEVNHFILLKHLFDPFVKTKTYLRK